MKPGIPQGTRDFSPNVVRRRQFILETIKSIFINFGFDPIETPAMENLQTLMGKYGEEGDRLIFKILNNGLNDPKNQEKAQRGFESILQGKSDVAITERALRYDLTIPFARYVVMHQNDLAFPFKRYQMQPVWRADRPQKGRYREFYQCDADVVGSTSLLNEAELLLIYKQVFQKLQIGGISIKINNRKILAGLAECCQAPEKLTDITVAIDKLDKIGLDAVVNELQQKSLSNEQIEIIKQYLSIDGNQEERLSKAEILLQNSAIGLKGLAELRETLHLHQLLSTEEYSAEVVVDFTLARGLNYYTGFITEVGTSLVKIGSIGGGGRYDDLTGLFGMKNMSGVGISFGIDRIYDVLESLDAFPETLQVGTQVLFTHTTDLSTQQLLSHVSILRKHNIAAEVYADISKLDKQLKYANKRQVPYVAIVGEEELQQNKINLKNMHSGEQQLLTIDQLINLLKA